MQLEYGSGPHHRSSVDTGEVCALFPAEWKDSTRLFVQDKYAIIKYFTGKIWREAARWGWWSGLFLGALALVALGEFALAIVLVILAAFSVSSRVWHWHGILGASALTNFLKIISTAFLIVAMGICTSVVLAIKSNSAWSHISFHRTKTAPTKEVQSTESARPTKIEAPYIYFTTSNGPQTIQVVSRDGKDPVVLLTTGKDHAFSFAALAADQNSRRIYFVDGKGAIFKCGLDGSGKEMVAPSNEAGAARDMRLDASRGVLFYLRPMVNQLAKVNVDGSDLRILIWDESGRSFTTFALGRNKIYLADRTHDFSRIVSLETESLLTEQAPVSFGPQSVKPTITPRIILTFPESVEIEGMGVDENNGKIYWTARSQHESGIWSATLDGNDLRHLTDDWGRALAIDSQTNKLYWPNPVRGGIMFSNLDGSDGKLFLRSDRDPTRLAILAAAPPNTTSPSIRAASSTEHKPPKPKPHSNNPQPAPRTEALQTTAQVNRNELPVTPVPMRPQSAAGVAFSSKCLHPVHVDLSPRIDPLTLHLPPKDPKADRSSRPLAFVRRLRIMPNGAYELTLYSYDGIQVNYYGGAEPAIECESPCFTPGTSGVKWHITYQRAPAETLELLISKDDKEPQDTLCADVTRQ